MTTYYVYSYIREDDTPYYIGKGKGRRAYSKYHNIHLPTDKSRIKFLYENLTEDEAHQKEMELIALYGREDIGTGILRNLTDGGEGTSGFIFSEESKAKMSAANTGKTLSEETKAKISAAHTGKTLSEETRVKLSANCAAKRPEVRAKISAANTGEKNPMYGKTLSEEHRAKIGAAMKGYWERKYKYI